VVFVASASAPLTESDCALLDAATAWTDAVVGAVSKIDAHRTWREVLRANRAALAGRTTRYADMPWLGVAAAPDIGAPDLDRLVEALRAVLAAPTLQRRNRLRAWHSHILELRCPAEPDGLAELSERRAALLSRRQLDKSQQSITLRAQTQQARLQLSSFTRNRCAAVRAELQRDAAATTGAAGRCSSAMSGTGWQRSPSRWTAPPPHAWPRPPGIFGCGRRRPTAAAAGRRAAPPLRSRRLETRLMALLGAGFGLGVALTLSRMLAGVVPGPVAAAGCARAGVGLMLWVIAARGLLRDRAVLERWVSEVTALRGTLEERVAARVLAAESVFGSALAERDVTAAARLRDEVAALDREIAERRAAQARAVAADDRRLGAIGAELCRLRADGAPNRPDNPGTVI
jgi:hypothetical protein